MATVRTAMSTLQEEIDELDDEISDAKGDTVSSYVSAGVMGRVRMEDTMFNMEYASKCNRIYKISGIVWFLLFLVLWTTIME